VSSDKLVLVDFFATWCTGCAKVYPALLQLAADPELQGRIAFVKVCNDRMGKLSRAEGAAALPHIGLYTGGVKLLDFQARPSRLHLLKANLLRILDEVGGPGPPDGKAWVLNQDGVVGLVDAAARAARQVENKAAVAQAAASTASLSDRLMAMAGGGGGGASSPAPAPSSSLADRLAALAGGGPPPPPASPTRPPPSPAEVAFRGHPIYGPMYNPRADPVFDAEIAPRMEDAAKAEHYLDYTGAALYLNCQVDAAAAELKSALFGNPHSSNPSSSRSDAAIESVRAQVLDWLGADPAEYQVVFTASATAAAKLVGEAFPWTPRSTYMYLRASHTSMLGLREYAQAGGARFRALTEEDVEAMVGGEGGEEGGGPAPGGDGAAAAEPTTSHSLFEFPAEENFAGVKHDPARWVGPVQATSTPSNRVLVALDASAWVPTQPLDLGLPSTRADYVFLSFYKVFGFPTGVGALIMRNEAAALLDRPYFGGGTVSLVTAGDAFQQAKCRPADRFADGSPSFLDIAALRHGFAAFNDLLGGAAAAAPHVATLAHWGAEALTALRHANGAPMVLLFGKHDHADWAVVQGGVLNFEALDARGDPLSYRAFEAAASAAGLHLRCGSLCAPGAAAAATDVSEAEIRALADSGDKEGCDDDVESILVERLAVRGEEEEMEWVRRPLGTIRASFGATSTFRDVEALVKFVVEYVREAGR
jgi:molybdenum cofactor sulfurtransferase